MTPIGKLFKWGTFAYEAFLALPFIGGAFVVANAWAPLGVAFLLHAVAVVLLLRERGPIVGNVVGIVTSVVALIPFVGWIMHAVTAIILLIEGISASRRTPRY
ncbi:MULTISPECIES: hypothetical protein [Paenibacillus]|uniref:Membrane protein n=3 Tax=Paenibacillus TaxID=44249 RepID=A0A089M563_9BACL|nr:MULTISPECIES: hypothetical protein [Paenibacillus]AIQ66653.1 membrane protein [Paenibacillus graminis]KWX72775.1 hypothetical protein AML91_20205 [Paenibacillus jilunlii]MCE3198467.1 hypothetical protein [Paenibacillus sonchi]MEC0170074.1 hypothetical protein [Paenibacillus graminis]QQZ63016.1 hypothetical protein JI735_11235 [Paenibacillus sonchi]